MTEEAQSNAFANQILDLIRAAKTDAECEALSEKYSAQFKRLEQINPARAVHIVNLTTIKRREFE